MVSATMPRVAWRNMWRNPRRTILALAAIGLSVTLVLIYDGLLRWETDLMLDTITGPMLGHVQIHAPGWRKNRGMDQTLRHLSETLDSLRRDREIAGATPRLYAPALAARGEEGFAVLIVGVDPIEESRPARLLARVSQPLSDRQVFVGRLLAEQMGVGVGDEIALVGQGADGSLANDLFTVAALVDTGVDLINRQAIVMRIESAQDLFVMPNEAHEIVVYARNVDRAGDLAARLRAASDLGATEVLDWQSLAPSMAELLKLVQLAWVLVLAIVLIAAAAGVANTMLMATFERTHELGMLLALGASPSRIVEMILLESVALGATGALIGSALGGALVAWAHQTGIDYAALTGGGPSQLAAFGITFSLRVYPRLVWVDIARAVVSVTATSVLAAAWPATRAAHLEPARALRD